VPDAATDTATLDPPVLGANPFVGLTPAQVAAALGRLAQRLVVEPAVTTAAATAAVGELIEVAVGRSDIAPDRKDRRFADTVWHTNPVFRRIMQSYLVGDAAARRVVAEVDLDRKSRDRAEFATTLLTSAVAPTNNPLTNPTAIAKAVATRGQSLRSGLRHFAHDLRHNGGLPSQVDTRPFEVGKNLATSPGQVVHRTEVFELIQYTPTTPGVHQVPLVVVPPQINKFYVTDLAPGRSLVESTVAAGVPYFAISWRNPTAEQRDWNLETYVEACLEAIDVACAITGSDQANTAGLCAGGVTLACTLGYLAAVGQGDRVASATFMVAGLDTSLPSTVNSLSSRPAIDAARRRTQRRGVLQGSDMAKVFAWLRPNDLVWSYWVNNYLLGDNPPPFDVLFWNNDTTRLPAALHSDFLALALENSLVEGSLVVRGERIDLGAVTCNAFVVAGLTDHIIPWDAAYRTTQALGGESRFVLSTGGHIQAILSPIGAPRAAYRTLDGAHPETAEAWHAAATTIDGSWWPAWHQWLAEHSGDSRPAPERLGSDAHPPLDAAPGRYVHL
jgi:polyhydroxyalkanoate synthase